MSRHTQDSAISLSSYLYETFTLCGPPFQTVPISDNSNVAVLLPHTCRNMYGLGFFHFARRYFGNRCFFLLLLLLRCFSSEGLLTLRCVRINLTGCPIRKSSDHFMFANPRSLSQLTTSFVASKSQGIPHMLFITFLTCTDAYCHQHSISFP